MIAELAAGLLAGLDDGHLIVTGDGRHSCPAHLCLNQHSRDDLLGKQRPVGVMYQHEILRCMALAHSLHAAAYGQQGGLASRHYTGELGYAVLLCIGGEQLLPALNAYDDDFIYRGMALEGLQGIYDDRLGVHGDELLGYSRLHAATYPAGLDYSDVHITASIP